MQKLKARLDGARLASAELDRWLATA